MVMNQYQKYRYAEIQEKLSHAQFHPLDVMVVGATGVGKSSTLNILFEQEVASVGQGVMPETQGVNHYYFSDKGIRLWDTPGLGDGTTNDKNHSIKLNELLQKSYSLDKQKFGFIDLVIIILDSSIKDLGTVYKLIKNVLSQHLMPDRILIALNKCDKAIGGRGWDYIKEQPEQFLKNFLVEKSISIQSRIYKSTNFRINKPLYYSAEFDFNLFGFLDLLIDNIPNKRRSFLN